MCTVRNFLLIYFEILTSNGINGRVWLVAEPVKTSLIGLPSSGRAVYSLDNIFWASGTATQLNFELPCSPDLHLFGVSSHFYSVTPGKYYTGLLWTLWGNLRMLFSNSSHVIHYFWLFPANSRFGKLSPVR